MILRIEFFKVNIQFVRGNSQTEKKSKTTYHLTPNKRHSGVGVIGQYFSENGYAN